MTPVFVNPTETGDEKFQNLISQVPVLMSTFIGPTFIVETVNKMALDIWCKSYEEVVNKPLFESSPELEAGLKSILDNIYLTGKPFISNEIPFELKRSGETNLAYFNSVYQPLLDGDRKIYGIILIGTEITETVNARKEIESSELFNRTVLDGSPDSIKVLDLEGKIQFVNSNGLAHLEVDNFSALKNKDWFGLWGAEYESLAKESFYKALAGNTARFTAFRYTLKGSPKWWDVVVSPMGNYDQPVDKIMSVARDITEQKNMEKVLKKTASHFKLATDSANVGIWSLDIETQELEWSGLHKKMWGYDDHRTDLTYEDWHSIILSEDKALAFEKVEEARVNRSLYEVEYRIKRPNDNVIRWMRAVGHYYYNEAGEAITLTGISLDITEQKTFTEELENKVRERTKELDLKSKQLEELNTTLDLNNIALENANAELNSFNYIASHDLQEPLRMIRMFSERILSSETISEKTQGYFNFIIKASERMRNLIVSLIDFSKANKSAVEFIACNLNSVVEEVKHDLQLSIAEKNAAIEYDDLPTISGMQIQLCQLFTNLIANSIKYSKPQISPLIKITSARIAGQEINREAINREQDYYAIKITDNGIGFEKEYNSKIFDVFQRLHGREKYSGTGIGLAIAKKIVTNHNGIIIAEGEPNVGATFTIYLPV